MHYITNQAIADLHFKNISPWLEDVYDIVFYSCYPGGATIDEKYNKYTVLVPIHQTNNHGLLSPCKPRDKINDTPYQINHYTPKGLQEFYNRILLAVEQGYTRTFIAGYQLVIRLDTLVDNKPRLHITLLDKRAREVASMALYGEQKPYYLNHAIHWEDLSEHLPAEAHNAIVDFNRLLTTYYHNQAYGALIYWVLMTDCGGVFRYSLIDKADIYGDLLFTKVGQLFSLLYTKLKGH